MPTTPMPRDTCFRLLLGDSLAKQLKDVPLCDIAKLAYSGDIASLGHVTEWDRGRLRAALRFAELLLPANGPDIAPIRGPAAIVQAYGPRTWTLQMRTIWLVCLDDQDCLAEEVLVHMGGRPTDLPPLRQFLRHALLRGVATAYVVDFRPLEQTVVHLPTVRALRDLRVVAEIAGVHIADWVVLGRHDAMSMADQLDTTALEGRKKRAA